MNIDTSKGVWFLVILSGVALIFSSMLILMPVPFTPAHIVIVAIEILLGSFIIGVGFEQINIPSDDEDDE